MSQATLSTPLKNLRHATLTGSEPGYRPSSLPIALVSDMCFLAQ